MTFRHQVMAKRQEFSKPLSICMVTLHGSIPMMGSQSGECEVPKKLEINSVPEHNDLSLAKAPQFPVYQANNISKEL